MTFKSWVAWCVRNNVAHLVLCILFYSELIIWGFDFRSPLYRINRYFFLIWVRSCHDREYWVYIIPTNLESLTPIVTSIHSHKIRFNLHQSHIVATNFCKPYAKTAKLSNNPVVPNWRSSVPTRMSASYFVRHSNALSVSIVAMCHKFVSLDSYPQNLSSITFRNPSTISCTLFLIQSHKKASISY